MQWPARALIEPVPARSPGRIPGPIRKMVPRMTSRRYQLEDVRDGLLSLSRDEVAQLDGYLRRQLKIRNWNVSPTTSAIQALREIIDALPPLEPSSPEPIPIRGRHRAT